MRSETTGLDRTSGVAASPRRHPGGAGRAAAGRSGVRDQRGAATAETVMMLPVLAGLLLALVWLLALAATQMRVVDAAREAARAAARDESPSAAVALARRVAPDGSTVRVSGGPSGTVTASVAVSVTGPGGLFRFLPGITVGARSVAAKESP